MGFKPTTQTKQPRSQATPLAGDVLGKLRAEIGGQRWGEGFSPLQREAGSNIGQFISGRSSPEAFANLVAPVVSQAQRETDRGAADIREAFTGTGNRLSSALAQKEGEFRNEAADRLNQTLAGMFQQEQGNLLSAIGQQYGMGAQNVAPFFDFAALGILPEQTIVGDSPFKQIGGLLQGGGSAAAAAKSDIRAKTDVVPAQDQIMDFFRQIGPIMFNYKNPESPGASPGRQMGVAAQDVERAGGQDAVKNTDSGKMVDFGQLLPAMMAGMSALVQRLDQLEGLAPQGA